MPTGADSLRGVRRGVWARCRSVTTAGGSLWEQPGEFKFVIREKERRYVETEKKNGEGVQARLPGFHERALGRYTHEL